ncbi:MAG: TolC family protein [Cyclobacteriaceae bacterium]|nr:TolC family protein [Cyclobacteriaceae bacterium]
MHKIISFVCILILAGSITEVKAQNAEKWSLKECIDYAQKNNLNVQRAHLNVENSQVDLHQSQYNRLPTLNGSVFNSYRWGRSIDPTTNLFTTQRINSNGFTGTSQVILFNGFQQINNIKANKARLESDAYALEKAINDVSLNVVSAYIQVIFARELLENARIRNNSTRAQLDNTKRRVDAGSLPITNLLDLQSQFATTESEVVRAENDVALSMLQLKQLLMIPGEVPFDIQVPDMNIDNLDMITEKPEDIFVQSRRFMPEVKSAEVALEGAEYNIKVAKGAHIPTVGVQGQIFSNYANTLDRQRFVADGSTIQLPPEPIGFIEGQPNTTVFAFGRTVPGGEIIDGYPVIEQWKDNLSISAGLNVSIPLFNGFRTRNNIQLAKIQRDRIKINVEETNNQLRQLIETAYTDAQASSKAYYAAEKQVEALVETLRAIERSYNLGASNIVDYQVASDNLFRAKSDLTRAKFDYIFKMKIIDFYLGNPLTLD